MQKQIGVWGWVIAWLITGCASPPPREVSQLVPLELVSTHHWQGEIEPCGCGIAPVGGAERIANFLKGIRSTNPTHTWYLIAGRTFLPAEPIKESQWNHHQKKALALVAALNTMKPKALALSARDLSLGWERLKALKAKSDFPWIVSNLTTTEGLWQDHLWVQEGGVNILIVGLSPAPESTLAKVTALPVKTAFENLRGKLPSKPDLVVVLNSLPREQANEAITALGWPAVVLGEEEGTSFDGLLQPEKTLINLGPTNRGQGLGHLKIGLQKPVKAFFHPEMKNRFKDGLAFNQADIEYLQSEITKASGATKTQLEGKLKEARDRRVRLQAMDAEVSSQDVAVEAEVVRLTSQWDGPNAVTPIVADWKQNMKPVATGGGGKKKKKQ